MPEEQEAVVAPAETSVRPANFSNASPFPTKRKKKDPLSTAIMAYAVVAILVLGGAIACVFSMKSPL